MRRPGTGGARLLSIAITPPLTSGLIGGSVRQLTAMGTYSNGDILNLTSTVSWSSSNLGVFTVSTGSGGGSLVAVAVGTAQVTATLDDVTSSESVTVSAGVGGLTGQLVSAPDDVGGSTGPLGTGLATVIALWVPADVTSVRVKIANRVLSYADPPIDQPTDVITGAKIAVGPLGSDGKTWTGSIVEVDGITLPAHGELYVSDPIDVTGMRNADGEIGVAWSVPAGPVFFCEHHGDFGYSSPNEDVTTLSGMVKDYLNPLFVFVEYEAIEHMIIIGDSLERGLSGSILDGQGTYKETLGYLVNTERGLACNRAAGSGQSLFSWADAAETRSWLWDFENFSGAKVLIKLGTNDVDIIPPKSKAAMQTALNAIISRVRAAGAAEVWVWTIPPAAAIVGTGANATRHAYNDDLRNGLISNVDYVLDADELLKDPAAPDQLLAIYATGDTLHHTPVAQRALYDRLVSDGKI